MLSDWDFQPHIVIATSLACAVYGAGIRRGRKPDMRHTLRHVAYFTGVTLVFVALESPVDTLADHLFWMHQIQHLLLRMVGPMLIALSSPQAVLIRGLPRALRGGALSPIVSLGVLRSVFGLITAAPIMTLLFIGALYVWQYPPIHNAAILNDGIHYAMHVTMLAAGLLFFWRVFDVRPAPLGISYGKRLMMLLAAMLTQIAMGAYLTLKSEILYPAYDTVPFRNETSFGRNDRRLHSLGAKQHDVSGRCDPRHPHVGYGRNTLRGAAKWRDGFDGWSTPDDRCRSNSTRSTEESSNGHWGCWFRGLDVRDGHLCGSA